MVPIQLQNDFKKISVMYWRTVPRSIAAEVIERRLQRLIDERSDNVAAFRVNLEAYVIEVARAH